MPAHQPLKGRGGPGSSSPERLGAAPAIARRPRQSPVGKMTHPVGADSHIPGYVA